ncbi:TonB-dependent receptor [Piscinibacter sp. SJAQ100]|uniref:TonB-dependent receptor n=1 Tax=Aquariibacter albus TaxID=2759899 RepID=A0A839HKB1_9BURK|nr:TonB-dependent receptor [Aquariibacter albus]
MHPLQPQPLLLALLAAFSLQAPTRAADAPASGSLPPVRVIGVTPLPGLSVSKDEVAAPVQTLSTRELDASHAPDLSAVLARRLGSVHVNEVQNNPFQPDLNYRGFTASPLLGNAQGLSVYLDGVRLNQPFGDVVSWDLIPKSALRSVTLMPGSNPVFGLNTLGGALAVETKDGLRNPGTTVQVLGGSHGRRAFEFATGGSQDDGLHWFVSGNLFRERGWRDDSPSDVRQILAKVGKRSGATDVALTVAAADTDLNGNGLQEQRFLDRDYNSVYTKPDNTQNRSFFLNFTGSHTVSDKLSFSGNTYYRRIRTSTFNGDLNDDSLDQSLYQPNATERAALTAAGYTGFPTAGENASNTPFPKWRCIAQALLNDEPAEKCNGVINRTRTDQDNMGLALQANLEDTLLGRPSRLAVGVAYDLSHVKFKQSSELGYLNPDRSVTGVGAFGDGGVTGGDVDGAPYDTRVDLRGRTETFSVYASDTLTLAPKTFLTLAGRYNHTEVRNRDGITPGGGPGSLDGNHSFSRFNPAVGLTFSPLDDVTAYLGANQGSRTPSAIELGCADPANPCKLPNAFAGDPPLKQVVTTTLEAGLRGRSGALSWNAGVFRSDNRDDLLFVADNTAGFGYFKNFGKTRRQGVELGASYALSRDLVVGGQYTFLDATFRSRETVNGSSNSSNEEAEAGFPGVDGTIEVRSGDRIPMLPRQIVKLFADFQATPSWSVGADLQAIGGSTARGNENGEHRPDGTYYLGSGKNGGYAVLNLNTSYQATKGAQFFANLNNVFDRKYSTAAQLGPTGFNAAGNFQARPFPVNANGDRPLQHATFYAPGAPRSLYVGLRYTFD